jgi:hypothetical protein
MQNNKRILIVAFLFHLPGLRLFYNIKFTDYPKFQNILASALTLLGCFCNEEKTNLQKGMNYKLRDDYSIILMSLRKNVLYTINTYRQGQHSK